MSPLYLIRPGRDICAACEPRQVLPRHLVADAEQRRQQPARPDSLDELQERRDQYRNPEGNQK